MSDALKPLLPNKVFKGTRRKLRKYTWLGDCFRIKDSVIPRIVGPVLTITLFATTVAVVRHYGKLWSLTNSVIPLLSVVVGLILVFRNSTSYERFWEGRKQFATLTVQIRNFSRVVWVQVGLPPTGTPPNASLGDKTPVTSVTEAQLKHRKSEVLRLALGFAYATKHYLRCEDGVNYDDYAGLLPRSVLHHHEQAANPLSYSATTATSLSASSSSAAVNEPSKRVRVKRSRQTVSGGGSTSGMGHTAVDVNAGIIPLPLIIAHELSLAIYNFRKEGVLETVGPAGLNAMSTAINTMVDAMTAMERIANTPIPKSYGIHLKQCITLYLFCLPLTMVGDLGWAMIPVVTVVAFTFMGIEGIAEEIEMPFGVDHTDLPLDTYCQDLREEVEFMINRLPEGGEGFWGYDDGQGDE